MCLSTKGKRAGLTEIQIWMPATNNISVLVKLFLFNYLCYSLATHNTCSLDISIFSPTWLLDNWFLRGKQ